MIVNYKVTRISQNLYSKHKIFNGFEVMNNIQTCLCMSLYMSICIYTYDI